MQNTQKAVGYLHLELRKEIWRDKFESFKYMVVAKTIGMDPQGKYV